jgi:hypothetical protein
LKPKCGLIDYGFIFVQQVCGLLYRFIFFDLGNFGAARIVELCKFADLEATFSESLKE